MAQQPETFTPAEIAEAFRHNGVTVEPWQIVTLCRLGKIKATRLNGTWRMTLNAVAAHINQLVPA